MKTVSPASYRKALTALLSLAALGYLLYHTLAGMGFFQISQRSPRFWEGYLCAIGVIINVFGMAFMLMQELGL